MSSLQHINLRFQETLSNSLKRGPISLAAMNRVINTSRVPKAIEYVRAFLMPRTEEHGSKARIARRMGISTPHLGEITTGKKGVSLEVLDKMAAAFGVSLGQIFSEATLVGRDLAGTTELKSGAGYAQALEVSASRKESLPVPLGEAHMRCAHAIAWKLGEDAATVRAFADELPSLIDEWKNRHASGE